eukprot:g10919.t1
MGPGTHKIPFAMHRRHRQQVAESIRQMAGRDDAKVKWLDVGPELAFDTPTLFDKAAGLAIFKGGGEQSLYDTDTTWDFRQEANFQYLFGCKEPGLYGALELATGKGYLFIPKLDEVYATWLGPIRGADWFKQYYEVDDVFYLGSEEAKAFLAKNPLRFADGTNLDSGAASWNSEATVRELATEKCGVKIDWNEMDQIIEGREINKYVWDALVECRARKSADEIKIMEFVCRVSAEAHIRVMKKVYEHHQIAAAAASSPEKNVGKSTPEKSPKAQPIVTKIHPGLCGTGAARMPSGGSKLVNRFFVGKEYLCEAEFKYSSFLRGCSRVGYSCICPSGERSAILHYGHSAEPNMDDVFSDEMKLHDMGAEYHCYTADVTCTFPVSGKFSEAGKRVYEAVWASVVAVEESLKPGVRYGDMHRLAQRTILEQLKGFIFKESASVDDMMAADLMGYFMPHGLGHMLGLAVHDVGGYEIGETKADYAKPPHNIKQNLRLNRVLKPNMVLTVEPGFYFIPHCVKQVFAEPGLSKFLKMSQEELLTRMTREVGGVRIEDNVVITECGCRVMNSLPRTVEEIEGVMTGKFEWDFEVECLREYGGDSAAAGGASSKKRPAASGGAGGSPKGNSVPAKKMK